MQTAPENISTKYTYRQTGVEWKREALSQEKLDLLKQHFKILSLSRPGARQSQLPQDMLDTITELHEAHDFAKKLIGRKARVVRIIAFDKTPQTNWGVPWHQDRTIAVQEKHQLPDFGPWSRKGTLHHVEPPLWLLDNMVTLRLHIDPCPITNGPLEVLSGTAKLGPISQKDVLQLSNTLPALTCTAESGDILAMHALTIHRSPKAAKPGHRRVLHLEYCGRDLPEPLEWALI